MGSRLGYFDPLSESNDWGLRHISDEAQLTELDAWLFRQDGQLHLAQNQQKELSPLTLDFAYGRTARRLKETRHSKQPLARACGLTKGRRPTIIDATAGFAQDALLLAAMGSKVTMLEQQPLIYALVSDALARGRVADSSWLNVILANIEYHHINACDYLKDHQAEVIYLDPMYPERDKAAKAKVKKGMQILRNLPGCYTDNEALFSAAYSAATQRVVVKRPVWANSLAERTPDSVVSIPNHNFDIYFTG